MYYAIGNAAETETHFRTIHAAVDKPIFAYDVPVRTHFKLPTDLLVRLGRDGVIAGVKDSSGDDVSFRQLLLAAKDIPNFDIFTGHEVVVDGALLGGAQGVVPGLGNVDPRRLPPPLRRRPGRRLGRRGRANRTAWPTSSRSSTPPTAASPAEQQASAPSRPPCRSWASSSPTP